MRRSPGLRTLVLAVALFAAPAGWACGEVLMWLDCCAGEESEPETAASPCHASDEPETAGLDGGAAGMDCCATASPLAPIQGVSSQSDSAVTALEPSRLQLVSVEVPVQVAAHPVDSWRLHDLGRYTLFSSFLL